MGKYNGGSKFGDKKDRGRFDRKRSSDRGFGRGGDYGNRSSMHRATCAECGDVCEVPFKPTGERPVYCSNCFGNQGGGNARSNRSGNSRDKHGRSDDKHMFDAICDECGDDCQVPFRPTHDKPIYCDSCFGGNTRSKKSERSAHNTSDVLQEIKKLNDKLDTLLGLMNAKSSVEKKKEVKPEKEDAPAEEKTQAKKAAKKAVKKVAEKKTTKNAPAKKAAKKSPAKKKK